MRVTLSYRRDPPTSPLSRWVHRRPEGQTWLGTRRRDMIPPMPEKVPGKGYPLWEVSHRGRTLVFASPHEIAHAVDVLGRRVLPRPYQLTAHYGRANSHWLSRLHASWTPWKVRQQLVAALSAIEF